MSSKHRVCCCGDPTQPCCGLIEVWCSASSNETTQVHFDGVNSVPEAVVPNEFAPSPPYIQGTLPLGAMLNLNDGTSIFTAQSAPGIYSGTTRLQALQALLANNAPITVDLSRIRVPVSNANTLIKHYRYQQYIAPPPPTDFESYWNGSAWAFAPFQPHIPYCGYACYGLDAVVETSELVPGSASNNTTPGFYTAFVSMGRRVSDNKFYAWAEKITSFKPMWWLEPFRYVNDTGAVRWSTGHAVKPRSCTQINNTELASYAWESDPYKPANGSVISNAPEIVWSTITDGPGIGCPTGLTYSENTSKSATNYRGACALYFNEFELRVSTGSVGLATYPPPGAAGLRRVAATSQTNRPRHFGSITGVFAANGSPTWVPLAFSKVAQNIVVTVSA